MFRKRMMPFIIALAMIISTNIGMLQVFAEPVNETAALTEMGYPFWPQFRGDPRLLGVSDAKTPITADEVEEKWVANLQNGWQNPYPILVGDYLYMAGRSADKKTYTLQKRSAADGTLVKEVPLFMNCGFFPSTTYADGKFFVSINEGRVQAFDAATMESLWISQETGIANQQSLAPVLYYNGYVYTGSTDSSGSTGLYYCISAKDEEPSNPSEIKSYTWSYAPKGGNQGYYWSGGAITGNAIVFTGESGELVSHHLTEDKVFDSFSLGSNNRSTIYYDSTTRRVFITTKDNATISSVVVRADGTFDRSSLVQKQISKNGNITSSPIVYNGRVYVGGGGQGAQDTPFTVLDAETLDIIYTVPIHTQSTPILTNAYATAENKHTVYIYVSKYSSLKENNITGDVIFCIKDFEGNDKPSYEIIATPSKPQFNTATMTIGPNGTLYYKNDSGNLFAFANKNGGNYTAQDVINAINRIPAADKLSLEHEVLVERAQMRYSSLQDIQKSAVTNIKVLETSAAKLKMLKDIKNLISKLNEGIDKLPKEITLEQRELVYNLWNQFITLSEGDRASITDAQLLIDAKAIIDKMADDVTVSDVTKAINDLPSDISFTKKELVYKVYKQYDALNQSLKARIINVNSLLSKKAIIDATEAEIEAINAAIWNLPISNITLSNKDAVLDIMKRYSALSEDEKKYIGYYNEVLEAKAIIDKFESDAVKNNALPKTGATIDTNMLIIIGTFMLLAGAVITIKAKKEQC